MIATDDSFERDLLLHVAARARELMAERDEYLAHKIIEYLAESMK